MRQVIIYAGNILYKNSFIRVGILEVKKTNKRKHVCPLCLNHSLSHISKCERLHRRDLRPKGCFTFKCNIQFHMAELFLYHFLKHQSMPYSYAWKIHFACQWRDTQEEFKKIGKSLNVFNQERENREH